MRFHVDSVLRLIYKTRNTQFISINKHWIYIVVTDAAAAGIVASAGAAHEPLKRTDWILCKWRTKQKINHQYVTYISVSWIVCACVSFCLLPFLRSMFFVVDFIVIYLPFIQCQPFIEVFAYEDTKYTAQIPTTREKKKMKWSKISRKKPDENQMKKVVFEFKYQCL